MRRHAPARCLACLFLACVTKNEGTTRNTLGCVELTTDVDIMVDGGQDRGRVLFRLLLCDVYNVLHSQLGQHTQ